VPNKLLQSKRLLQFGDARRKCGANFRSPTIGADFYCPAQDINLPYALMPRLEPVYERTENKEKQVFSQQKLEAGARK
jgi:hypothetical protein